jgi:hypothetical protein
MNPSFSVDWGIGIGKGTGKRNKSERRARMHLEIKSTAGYGSGNEWHELLLIRESEPSEAVIAA